MRNEKTGEILDSAKIKMFIDFEKAEQYRKSLGYYQIITSELMMDAREVIDKYHSLPQIEDRFRAMKGDLETCKDTGACDGTPADLYDCAGHAADRTESDCRFRERGSGFGCLLEHRAERAEDLGSTPEMEG